MDVVDIHTHAISPVTARFPLAPLGGRQSDWSRTRPVSAEQLLAAMDEAGVAKVALVHASTAYGHDAPYAAECVRHYPDRFAGVFSVDMLAGDASFPRIVEAFGANRIAFGSNFPAHEGPMKRFLHEAQEALACLSNNDRAEIFSGTAKRLYPKLAN